MPLPSIRTYPSGILALRRLSTVCSTAQHHSAQFCADLSCADPGHLHDCRMFLIYYCYSGSADVSAKQSEPPSAAAESPSESPSLAPSSAPSAGGNRALATQHYSHALATDAVTLTNTTTSATIASSGKHR
jgi:hypothetical protein